MISHDGFIILARRPVNKTSSCRPLTRYTHHHHHLHHRQLFR